MSVRRKAGKTMNRYKLYKAGVDTNEGISRFGGKIESYEKYLYKFPADENYLSLCDALQVNDVKAAFAAAHALKGVAGNLSLVKLRADIEPLVEELRHGNMDNADELMKPVTADYDAVLSALSENK